MPLDPGRIAKLKANADFGRHIPWLQVQESEKAEMDAPSVGFWAFVVVAICSHGLFFLVGLDTRRLGKAKTAFELLCSYPRHNLCVEAPHLQGQKIRSRPHQCHWCA